MTGEWWSPDEPEVRRAGTLRIDAEGEARLTLNDPRPQPGLLTSHRDYPVLHGITDDGKRVTLHDCFDFSSSGPIQGLGRRVIHVTFALIGIHADGVDPSLSAACAVFSGARQWYGRSNLKVETFTSMQSVRFGYEAEPTITLFEEDGLTLKMYAALTAVANGLEVDGSYRLKEDLRFELDASPVRPMSELNRVLMGCKDFLSIATQSYCENERWFVYQGAGKELQEANFHAPPVFRDKAGQKGVRDMLFRFQDIAEDPAVFFSRWLKEADRLASIRSLYFLAVYGDHFVQGRFLALTQALEAFHRRYRSAAPAELTGKRLSTFERQYSLGRRFADLFNEHHEALKTVVSNPEGLLPEIISRRRRFTHFPVDEDAGVDERHDWLGYNALLRFLLELCFLKLAGFTDEKLTELASRNHQRGRMIRRFLEAGNGTGPLG